MFDASSQDVIGLSDPEFDPSGESTDRDWEITCAELEEAHDGQARHLLPSALESIPPGPYLAAIVTAVDRTHLNGHDAVRLMQAEARLSSHYDAQKLATMVEVAMSPVSSVDSPVERTSEVLEFAEDEIAAALQLTRRAAKADLDLAYELSGCLNQVWSQFQEGLLDLRRVRVFANQLSHLPEPTIRTVLPKVLDISSELTAGQLRARLAREVMLADPDAEGLAYEAGVADRKIVLQRNPDHTANILASNLPAERAAMLIQQVSKRAQDLKTNDETRTIDQLRADVFLDLMGGGGLSTGGGGVHITVDLSTLAELSKDPGDLGGYGPVVAGIARKVARAQSKSTWDFTVYDNQGKPILTDTTRRRPSARVGRKVSATYRTCVAPGCRMPAHQCDLDHRRPWSDGGDTDEHNLQPLCRHHHMMKHHAPWVLERTDEGDHRWTTRLGHTYFTRRGPPRE